MKCQISVFLNFTGKTESDFSMVYDLRKYKKRCLKHACLWYNSNMIKKDGK